VSIKLKKPSEIFKKEENISVDNVIEEVVQKKELATFSDAFESFKNNLNKIESISNFSNVLDDYKINVDKINYLSKNVEDIRIEIQNLLKKEDLNNAMMSQLLIVEQSIRDVQNKVKGINEKNLNDIRSDISNLTDNLNEFVEFEAPKYKNLIIDSEFRISSKYNKLEENTNQTITNIEKTINKKFIEIGDTLNSINDESLNEIIQDFRLLEFTFKEIKEKEIPKYKNFIVEAKFNTESKIKEFNLKLDNTVSDLLEKINSIDLEKTSLVNSVCEKIKEVTVLNNNLSDEINKNRLYKQGLNEKVDNLENKIGKNIDVLNETFTKKVSSLEIEILRNESHLKIQNDNLQKIQEDIFSSIKKLDVEEIKKNNYELTKKLNYLQEIFGKFNEKEILTENIITEPAKNNNKDPLTPLDKNFVTFDDLSTHYRTFINRIQMQLSTLGGGGETQLKYLDDIVGIATNPSAYDGKFLTYDHNLEKFKFDIVPETEIEISEQNIVYVAKDGNDSNSGSLSRPKLTIKAAVGAATSDTVIKVAPGTYIEDNPIILPDEVTVIGHSLRETTIIPQNDNSDLFYVGNGNYIAEMSFRGSLLGKAIFTFDPLNERYISQSPYIQNCTNFIPDSVGMKVDGKDAIGPLKSMVLDSYTQYNQGGIGASITNEGYAQLVSLFTICNDIAVYCGSGGACDLTNSNSSFGNFGLVADGVSGKKYTGIVTVASSQNSDTFVVNLFTPILNVVDAEYNNESGSIKITTDQPHKFNVGMAVTIAGLGFTCPFEDGVRIYPSGTNGYVFNVETVAPGRYLDAANLILSNKLEIQDKSLASVALGYTDFYFPGDEETNSRSRYYDSYRLIQKNKQEILDKSIGAISIEHPDFYFPGDEQTNSRSRYFDSYRLIQKNKDVIVSIAWTNTVNTYPSIVSTEEKCKRDIGFFIDAISTDILTGGNKYSRDFTLQYFDASGSPISNGLVGEEVESIFAFEEAMELMKDAITNTLVGAAYSDLTITVDPLTGSNFDSNSCSDVQSNINNLVGIVTSVISVGNTSSLSGAPNLGFFNLSVGVGTTSSVGGYKCARDIGYLVDAISTDLFTGGNKYSRDFTLQYFDSSGSPISNGLVGEEIESITAFNSVGYFSKKAITNQLNYKEIGISSGFSTYPNIGTLESVLPSGNPSACIDVQQTIDSLVGIVTIVIGSGSKNYLNTFTENPGLFVNGANKCHRDIGYIVDSIIEDLTGFTNSSIINSTKKYFNYSGQPLVNGLLGEESQSVLSFNSARDYMKLAINNQLNVKDLTLIEDPLTGSNIDPNSCANVKNFIDTEISIITTAISDGNLNSVPSTVSLASTIFTVDVGIATQPHFYNSGGTVKINVIRPFDGQSIYFDELFYEVKTLKIINGGSGYTTIPTVEIESPDTPWGIKAQAVPIIENGVLVGVDMLSNGRGYRVPPKVTISSGINTAVATAEIIPEYYTIRKSTEITNNISIITLNENVAFDVQLGVEVNFFKQSRILATGHSFEFIGSGTDIANALPFNGGVPPNPDNETDSRNGGLVVYSSTNQSGNFKIGDGVTINQNTGSISGQAYSKSLLSTMTPYILSLGGF
jgi:hypothetical protein